MLAPEQIEKALHLLDKILHETNSVQLQHNTMLHDLYERIAKLEERANDNQAYQ